MGKDAVLQEFVSARGGGALNALGKSIARHAEKEEQRTTQRVDDLAAMLAAVRCNLRLQEATSLTLAKHLESGQKVIEVEQRQGLTA